MGGPSIIFSENVQSGLNSSLLLESWNGASVSSAAVCSNLYQLYHLPATPPIPPPPPGTTCQQYKWWARQQRGVARQQLAVIEINSLHFLLSLIKTKRTSERNQQKTGAKSGIQWGRHGAVQWGVGCFFFSFVHFGLENGGLTAAFEATRWQCHLATTLLAVMTALQGVPLEFLPEQLLAIIWSAARAVSPGITALPLDKRTSPVGLGLGLRLGTGTHSSAIVGPASTCDYYHQFCAGRVSDDCSRERKPGNISTYPRCSSGACYCFSQPLGGWLQWLQSFNYTRTKIIGNLPYYFTWVTLPRKSTMKWCAYLTSDIFEAM